MKNRFVEWSKNKYSRKQRYIALIPLGILFAIALPVLLLLTAGIDETLDLPKFILEPVNAIIGIIFIITGLIPAFWSIKDVFDEGGGTPAPIMPTQKLIRTGPYVYCRNPMALGTIISYLGVVVIAGSFSSLILYLLLVTALLFYIKHIEEKELEARFGQDYLEYKKKIPFIIPRIKI
jgi:protein-S-isoprenylcysteine O-methyltransferase Ste14